MTTMETLDGANTSPKHSADSTGHYCPNNLENQISAVSIEPERSVQKPSAVTTMPPCLQGLPDELLVFILNDIHDSKRLYPFLFSRQFHNIALEALYSDLCHVVLDPTLPSAIAGADTAAARGRTTMSTSFLNALLNQKSASTSLLASAAKQKRYPLAKTRSLSVRISEATPIVVGSASELVVADPGVISSTGVAAWDGSIADILRWATRAEEISFDWIGTMPTLCNHTIGWSSLRDLSIHGITNGSDHFYSTVPYGLKMYWAEKFRFENVQFIRKDSTPEERLAALSRPPKTLVRTSELEVVDCKATNDYPTRGWLGIAEAHFRFNDDRFHVEILNLLLCSASTVKLVETLALHPPATNNLAKLAYKFYRQLALYKAVTHLAVSFWLTPCDGSPHLPSLSSDPMWSVTRLELSLGINDIADLPSFYDAIKDKLATMEALNFFPALKFLKLVPSPWMREAPDVESRDAFDKLLQSIKFAWSHEKLVDVFGWKKSTKPKEVLETLGENISLWESGVLLDITEIAKFVDGDQETRRDLS